MSAIHVLVMTRQVEVLMSKAHCQPFGWDAGRRHPDCRMRQSAVRRGHPAPTGRGRPRDYHDEACRRATAEAKRRLEARLEHYKEQVEILSERYAAYERAPSEGESSGPTDSTQVTADQVRIAREAVSKVDGAAPFLRKHDGEFAADLVELLDAVAPVVRSHI